MDIPFLEDSNDGRLPEGQPVIETRNVKRVRKTITLATDLHKAYPEMAVITGGAGEGKSVARRYFQDTQTPLSHTGLPADIGIVVKPSSTPRALGDDIMRALKETPRGRNIYQVADMAAVAIVRNDIRSLLIDEGDRLNEASFEVLRYLFDETGVIIIVVGLPAILNVIDRQEKFASRVGLRMTFRPLALDEVLDVVIPGLVFPRLIYDKSNEEDRAMAVTIWERVHPSFRKLRAVLQVSSQIAVQRGAKRITSDIVREAFTLSQGPDRPRRSAAADGASGQGGPLEKESEQRHDEKDKDKGRGDEL